MTPASKCPRTSVAGERSALAPAVLALPAATFDLRLRSDRDWFASAGRRHDGTHGDYATPAALKMHCGAVDSPDNSIPAVAVGASASAHGVPANCDSNDDRLRINSGGINPFVALLTK